MVLHFVLIIEIMSYLHLISLVLYNFVHHFFCLYFFLKLQNSCLFVCLSGLFFKKSTQTHRKFAEVGKVPMCLGQSEVIFIQLYQIKQNFISKAQFTTNNIGIIFNFDRKQILQSNLQISLMGTSKPIRYYYFTYGDQGFKVYIAKNPHNCKYPQNYIWYIIPRISLL